MTRRPSFRRVIDSPARWESDLQSVLSLAVERPVAVRDLHDHITARFRAESGLGGSRRIPEGSLDAIKFRAVRGIDLLCRTGRLVKAEDDEETTVRGARYVLPPSK